MAKIVMEEQDTILTFPVDSILELKIEEAVTETVQGRGGEPWTKVKFKFKILGIQAIGDGSPKEPYENWITKYIYGSVPFRLTDSPENKLRIWAEAIFRQELGLGFELDTDMFVGRQVRGLTSQYDAKAKDANGVPFKRAQIETLLPFGGGAAPTTGAATAPAAADPWGDSWGKGDEPPF
jgi:hypothetical protein